MARLRPPDAPPDRSPVARELCEALRQELSDEWVVVLRPLPGLPREDRLQLTGWALVGPPGVLWLAHGFRFRWEAGGWWFAGHGARDVVAGARGAEDRVRSVVGPHARTLGGGDVVLGHGVLLATGGLPADAPGDRFVAWSPEPDGESLAAFVDRLAARGRVARRVERPPFTPAEVERLAALLDPGP